MAALATEENILPKTELSLTEMQCMPIRIYKCSLLAVQTPEDPPNRCVHCAADVMRYTEQRSKHASANKEETQLKTEAPHPMHHLASGAPGIPAVQSNTPDSEFVHRDGEPVVKHIR